MRSLIVALSLVIAMGGCTTMGQPKVVDMPLDVAELAGTVEKAWQEEAGEIDKSGLRLKSVSITVLVKKSKAVEGGVEVLVLSAKSKTEVTTSQSLVVKIAPPGRNLLLSRAPDLGSELRQAFKNASAVSKRLIVSGGDPALRLNEVSTSIGFDVVSSGSAGLKVELGPIKFGPGVSSSVSGTHRIDMTFETK
jgi:hypothetical protein